MGFKKTGGQDEFVINLLEMEGKYMCVFVRSL